MKQFSLYMIGRLSLLLLAIALLIHGLLNLMDDDQFKSLLGITEIVGFCFIGSHFFRPNRTHVALLLLLPFAGYSQMKTKTFDEGKPTIIQYDHLLQKPLAEIRGGDTIVHDPKALLKEYAGLQAQNAEYLAIIRACDTENSRLKGIMEEKRRNEDRANRVRYQYKHKK